MRILLISSEFPPGPGGIGTQAFELARHLTRFGWEVRVVAPQDYAEVDEILLFNQSLEFQIERVRARSGRSIAFWRTVRRQDRRWKPQVILATGDPAVYVGVARGCRSGVPVVAVSHGRTPRGLERRLLRWACAGADAVVFVSHYTKNRMLEIGVRPRQSWCIHNGADAETFRVLPAQESRDFRRRLGFAGRPLIVTVGHVSDRKGQEVVIRALPEISSRVPGVVYLMAGLPTRQDSLSALAARLGVADQVHFLGRLDRGSIVSLLNAADLFVLTSRHSGDEFEGFGIVVLEAALCGTPAVISNGSGLVETVVEGETGLGVPEDDPQATAAAVATLLSDESRRQRMAAAALCRAAGEFTWERRVREYDVHLRSLLESTC